MYIITGFVKIRLKDDSEGYHIYLSQPISAGEGDGYRPFTRCFYKLDAFHEADFQVGDEVVPDLSLDKEGKIYIRQLSRKE